MYRFPILSRLPITLAFVGMACLAPFSLVNAAQPSPEIVVAPDDAPRKIRSVTATDAAGNFVVAWTNRAVNQRGDSVLIQRFDSTGVPRGAVFPVTTSLGLNSVDVGMDDSGRFFVVWTEVEPDPTAALILRVRGRHFDSNGVPDGAEILIGSVPQSNGAQTARVAMNGVGEAVAVWDERSIVSIPVSLSTSIITTTIKMQRFNARGQRSGLIQTVARSSDSFLLPYSTVARDFTPEVAINDSGRIVVAWGHETSVGDWVVYARRYGPQGVAVGAAFQASSDARFPGVPSSFQKAGSLVAIDDAGQFTLAWVGYTYVPADQSSIGGVFKRRFGADGQPLEDEVLIMPRVDAYRGDFSLGLDGAGSPIVAWVTVDSVANEVPVTSTVDAQRFDTNGIPSGVPIRLNTQTVGPIGALSLAPLPGNRFLAGWLLGQPPYSSFNGEARVVLCCSGN